MRRFLNGLILGLIIGGASVWYYLQQHPNLSESTAKRDASLAVQKAGEAAEDLTDAFKAKLDSLDLRPEQIKDDLARTGKVFRRQAREVTGQVVDAATDARITTAIKAKLALDKELSARAIAVSTDQGHVTLSGTVSSSDQIGRAILLAMETDGVQDVTATLAIKANH